MTATKKYIQPKNFIFLPKKFQKQHMFCDFILFQIETFLTDEKYSGLKVSVLNLNESELPNDDEHAFEFLNRVGRQKEYNDIIRNQIIYGLLIDTCYFLKSALNASLEKRLTVAFALIRKPFVYDLIIFLRLFLTSDFIDDFNKHEEYDSTKLSKEDLKELLELSEEALLTKSIKGAYIYDLIFNQEIGDSLINLSNKALHPSTTRNKKNLTGLQNLNFIFSTDENIDGQWNYLYSRLRLLLIYLNEILEYGVFSSIDIDIDMKIYEERITERAKFLSANS